MCTEKEIVDYCKQLEELPAPLSPERLKALYGPAMERSRGFIHMAFAPSVADVVVSLLSETGHTMMRIISQAAEVASAEPMTEGASSEGASSEPSGEIGATEEESPGLFRRFIAKLGRG